MLSGTAGRMPGIFVSRSSARHTGCSSSAAKRALKERTDQPDIVVLVEIDITPMNAWMLKEGDNYGNDVPRNHEGGYLYTEGSVRR